MHSLCILLWTPQCRVFISAEAKTERQVLETREALANLSYTKRKAKVLVGPLKQTRICLTPLPDIPHLPLMPVVTEKIAFQWLFKWFFFFNGWGIHHSFLCCEAVMLERKKELIKGFIQGRCTAQWEESNELDQKCWVLHLHSNILQCYWWCFITAQPKPSPKCCS